MTVLICGGRDFNDALVSTKILDEKHKNSNFAVIVHGAAAGEDTLAEIWGQSRGIKRAASRK